MEKIKELLASKGLAAPDKDIADTLKEYEIDPDKVTDVDAKAIADELEHSGKAKLSKQIKKSSKSSSIKPQAAQNGQMSHDELKAAVALAFRQSQEQVQAFADGVYRGGDKWRESKIQELLTYTESLPTQIAKGFAERLNSEESPDLEHFRKSGEDIFADIVGN